MKTEPTEGPSYILSCLLQWWMIRQKIEDHKKLSDVSHSISSFLSQVLHLRFEV